MSTFLLQPTAPDSTSAPAPASGDGAQGSPAGGALGGLGTLLFPLLLMAFFFWMTRNQSKKQKELESSIKAGDRVVTRAGAIGKVTKVGETTMEIELAPGVNVTFLKSAIEGLHSADPKSADPKSADAKSADAKKAENKPADKSKSDKDSKDKS